MTGSVLAQERYFPPNTGSTWETTDPQSLGWCQDRIDSLLDFVGSTHAKAFIILKGGKIVVEKYYDSFTVDSAWYWASAGKVVTAFLVGHAQENGLLDISAPTSTYLGDGWTSCTKDQEDFITVRHQLTMTTGIDGRTPDDNCTEPSCLKYRDAPDTRWDYYNATYLLLQDVIAKASNLTYQQYYFRNLASRTGMGGLWIDGVLYSKPRAVARFGLLVLNDGVWNSDTIIRDTAYLHQAMRPSQSLNPSYGYLWWLNGQGSYLRPGIPFVYSTDLVPTAPKDMVAGLGKNDQKLYLIPSQDLVVVRLGNPASEELPALSGFDTDLWRYISALPCSTRSMMNDSGQGAQGASSTIRRALLVTSEVVSFDNLASYRVYDMAGRLLTSGITTELDLTHFGYGPFIVEVVPK